MLPCPGEKNCFVKTMSWCCKYTYSATLRSRLFHLRVKWVLVSVSEAGSFRIPQHAAPPMDQHVRDTGRRAGWRETPRGNFISQDSLYHCSQRNSFFPINVGKLNEHHNENHAAYVCRLKEGRWGEWMARATYSLQRKDTTDTCEKYKPWTPGVPGGSEFST